MAIPPVGFVSSSNPEIDVIEQKKRELASEYVQMKETCDKLKKQLDKKKSELCKLYGLESGSITKEEYEDFERQCFEIENVCKILLFCRQSVSTDWEYLEKVLHPNQVNRAKKISYSSIVKIGEE